MISACVRTGGTGFFGCWARQGRAPERRALVATRSRRAVRIRQRKRSRLRLRVLRLGGLLGWGPRDIIGFAEALTGRPWRRGGSGDLESVRDEFLALVGPFRRRPPRRSVRPPMAITLVSRGYEHAIPW